MVDQEEIRLQRMGLTKLTKDDTFIEHEEEWDSRNYLHEALKKSDHITNKPAGNYFEIVANPEDNIHVSCHLVIPVVVIKAIFENLGVDVRMEAEYDWAMEEAAEWSKEYLAFDETEHEDRLMPFRHASDPETYSVPNYYEYIPSHVRNAEKNTKQNSSTSTLKHMQILH